jgi:heat-inducible transcriptional repressor
MGFDQIRLRLQGELVALKQDVSALMSAAIEVGSAAMTSPEDLVVSGERNLLGIPDLSTDMGRLRELFNVFERKTALLHLLDTSLHAHGVQIFIGGESGISPLDECSIVTAPYEVDGEVVGTLGVIGPTRMAYERVIPIVDITAKLIGSALSHR